MKGEKMTNKEHIEAYKKREQEGNFNVDINPVNWDECYPVTSKFKYIKTRLINKISDWFKQVFIIAPFTRKLVRDHKIQVIGKENLKGIKSAIVTSNHFFMFDCLAIRHAIKHKHKYVVAEFNNRKGKLGDYMRADGIMPLSPNFSVQKAFNEAISYHLKHNNYIVFYPEQAMWYMYEKPRPFKVGAFHYAVKNDVPIIPIFITLTNSGRYDEEGLPIKNFIVNIMKPIYANPTLSQQENIKMMMDTNYKLCVSKYEEFYDKKLVYNTQE